MPPFCFRVVSRMKYVILALYHTGDSENSYDTSHELAYVWNDLEVAKQALKWLNEHHEYYEAEDFQARRPWAKSERDISDVKTKPWYHEVYKDWHRSVVLPGNDGTTTIESINYHGYFEGLHSLEILQQEDRNNDMKFSY